MECRCWYFSCSERGLARPLGHWRCGGQRRGKYHRCVDRASRHEGDGCHVHGTSTLHQGTCTYSQSEFGSNVQPNGCHER
eukprot:symbB.v1.2.017375.t1/scaffold1349.1/size123878/2